jgi:hypothetical protein
MPYVLSLTTIVVPSILLTILYCRLARRWGIGRKWTLVACMALAVLAALICWQHFETSAQAYGTGGFWWDTNPIVYNLGFHSLMQLGQFLIPLATGWWFMRRNRDRGQMQLAS